jgi:hypothetical protein
LKKCKKKKKIGGKSKAKAEETAPKPKTGFEPEKKGNVTTVYKGSFAGDSGSMTNITVHK